MIAAKARTIKTPHQEATRDSASSFTDQSLPQIHPAWKKAYQDAYTQNGTQVLNVTNAKELFPEYAASKESRTALGNAVHPAAEALTESLWRDAVKRPAPAGKYDAVVLMAGPSAAGKSTALTDLGPEIGKAKAIYDTHMRDLDQSRANCQAALQAGNDVTIAYVHRDPSEALDAMLQRGEESGRVRPVENFAQIAAQAPETVRALQQEYAGNPHVHFVAIDNSKGPGNATVEPIEALGGVNYDEGNLKADLTDQATRAGASGQISDRVASAALGGGEAGTVGGDSRPETPTAGLASAGRGGYGARAESKRLATSAGQVA